jgi:hypothetical protein
VNAHVSVKSYIEKKKKVPKWAKTFELELYSTIYILTNGIKAMVTVIFLRWVFVGFRVVSACTILDVKSS